MVRVVKYNLIALHDDLSGTFLNVHWLASVLLVEKVSLESCFDSYSISMHIYKLL